MNWIDLLLVFVVLFAVVAGWHRGFILGIIDLLTWTSTLVIGYVLYTYTADLMAKVVKLGPWQLPLAFILTCIAARLLIGILGGLIIRTIPTHVTNDRANKLLGIIPGAINGWLYAVILSALLLALPLKDSITKETRNSRFGTQFAMQSEWANRKLAPVFDEAIRQTMNSLTVREGSHESVKLPFTYNKAVVSPSLEEEMLVLVNEERTKRGLKPLQADPQLTRVARAHSNDMFVRGYFAHLNPEGKNPFDRMKQANVTYTYAGENLALAQTLEIAHNGLMNSPGHRANILNPAYGRVGIGIMDGGYYGLMISQEFRD